MIIIGDVHGKIQEYKKIIDSTKEKTIQVGDFGFKKQHEWHLENINSDLHKINFGNHDDTTFLNSKHSLGNYSLIENEGEKIMTVRGAYSIDKIHRTEGIDWWNNEELTYEQLSNICDIYHFIQPNIMITHDCPSIIRDILFGIKDKSITSNALEIMFSMFKPKLWIFGHHHKSIEMNYKGTKFICLNELKTITI